MARIEQRAKRARSTDSIATLPVLRTMVIRMTPMMSSMTAAVSMVLPKSSETEFVSSRIADVIPTLVAVKMEANVRSGLPLRPMA